MSDIKRFYLAKKKKKNSTTFNVKNRFLEGEVNLALYSRKKERRTAFHKSWSKIRLQFQI